MRKIIIVLVFIQNLYSISYGQNTDEILEEGRLLYRLEKASWYGTDDFVARFPNQLDSVGGYLSYVDQDNKVVSIFFRRSDPFQILVRYLFDSIPQQKPLAADLLNRSASPFEKDLIMIRQDARQQFTENKDGFFSFYRNTALNAVPVIKGKQKRVFILTGPKVSDIVVIGNDYLLSYDKNNKLKKKKKIHDEMFQYPYNLENIQVTRHKHNGAHPISSTDICTLLLYKDFIGWKQHYVFSKKNVSIFDLEKENLLILKRTAWERILKSQEKR